MADRPRAIGSFGAPAPDPKTTDDQQQPVPVLHVGEVHAELRLHITSETLTELGSQIGSMIAQATREGFDAGLAAAMADGDSGEQSAGFGR
jgi:hypothetical protein